MDDDHAVADALDVARVVRREEQGGAVRVRTASQQPANGLRDAVLWQHKETRADDVNREALLQRVDERRLLEVAEDPVFLGTFNKVLSAYDTYHTEPMRRDDVPPKMATQAQTAKLHILAAEHGWDDDSNRARFEELAAMLRQMTTA